MYGSSHQRCSVKKNVLRNSAKFTAKQLWRLFFNKGLQLYYKIGSDLAQVFSFEFYEISKNTFSTERLRMTASARNEKVKTQIIQKKNSDFKLFVLKKYFIWPPSFERKRLKNTVWASKRFFSADGLCCTKTNLCCLKFCLLSEYGRSL